MFDVIPFSTIISFIFYLLKSPISSSLRQWLFQLVTAHQKYNHRSLPVRPKFGAAILITTFTCKLQSTRVELSRRQHYHNYQHFPIQPKPPKKHRSRITRGPSRESLRDYLIFFFFCFEVLFSQAGLNFARGSFERLFDVISRYLDTFPLSWPRGPPPRISRWREDNFVEKSSSSHERLPI